MALACDRTAVFSKFEAVKAQAAGVEFHADAIDPTNSWSHRDRASK